MVYLSQNIYSGKYSISSTYKYFLVVWIFEEEKKIKILLISQPKEWWEKEAAVEKRSPFSVFL